MTKFNIQQVPKDRRLLECFRARPGHKLVSIDYNSIENVVLAEASQDPTLMKLYGPDAKPNCGYLFFGSQIPGLKDNILKYYNPDNPTEESIELAKKHAKLERAAAKVVVLGCFAEGTPIATRRGVIPIEEVTSSDQVWDGLAWVATGGAVYRGLRSCITHDNITATPDHPFKLNTGDWCEFRKIQEGTALHPCERPKLPSYKWADVWRMGSTVALRWFVGNIQVCISKLSPHSKEVG